MRARRARRERRAAKLEPVARQPRPLPTRWLVTGGILLLVLYTVGLFAHQIDLTSADLGRHLKNGELFLETFRPLETNTYSYTEPDHPVVNHHWGSGVLFFLVWRVAGWTGLTVFYVAVHAALVLLLVRVASRQARAPFALLAAAAALPLLAFRPEIRPEGLSYLLLAVDYALLWGVLEGRLQLRWLGAVPVLQVLWTNLHLFFVFGPLLAAVATWEAWRCQPRLLRPFAWTLVACAAACLLNPFGLAGILEPLTIFEEYGYAVAENQSVLELQRSYNLPVLIQFELLCVLGLVLAAGAWSAGRPARRRLLPRLILLALFAALAWKVGRAVALFALVLIPIGAWLAELWIAAGSARARARAEALAWGAAGLLLVVPWFWSGVYLSPWARPLGTGLLPETQASAEFFQANGLEGPIFNDYDIGGYLIFHLYPNERVFVDNRPEAYTVSFFQDVYIPMQQDEAVWRRMEQRYGFNAIYFSRRDRAPWAKPFLVRRLQDPSWAPVYADSYALILLKRNARNRELIERFEPRGG